MNDTTKSLWESYWIDSYTDVITMFYDDPDALAYWEDEED